MQTMRRLGMVLRFWSALIWVFHRRVPSEHRRWLRNEEHQWQVWIRQNYGGVPWQVQRLQDAVVLPFVDLLNRPAGGEAYFGGVLLDDPRLQPALRHFRGEQAIDRPLTTTSVVNRVVDHVDGRLFWCGPLAYHFGHQIADFSSRVLLSSLDCRDGELLFLPWKTASNWADLKPWQKSLLSYLNPGKKGFRIADKSLLARELVVYPQQARMRAAPTLAHLEALSICETSIVPHKCETLYVSRSRAAPCTSASTLSGGFAAEALFERMLAQRGVNIVYPEEISLEEQLGLYLGAKKIILSEGSAQHCLELLSYHAHKKVVIICRRPQKPGMNLPLLSRFPLLTFVDAIIEYWRAFEGHEWNGISTLNWFSVAKEINKLVQDPITYRESAELMRVSQIQLLSLRKKIRLVRIS